MKTYTQDYFEKFKKKVLDKEREQLREIRYGVRKTHPDIPPFSEVSFSKLKELITDHKAGKINLYDYYLIGDTKEIWLDAIPEWHYEGEKMEPHARQKIEIVLVDRDVMVGEDGEKCVFVWNQKDALGANSDRCERNESGVINFEWSNKGGFSAMPRHKWLNLVYLMSLPEKFRDLCIPVWWDCSIGDGSSEKRSFLAPISLPCEEEVFGETIFSAGLEGKQWEWFKEPENRIKRWKDEGGYPWWLRSPDSSGTAYFCRVGSDGSAYYGNASNTRGIAPAGCL